MRICGMIPYWLGYKVDNSEHRNLKKLGGRYLINYSLDLLGNCPDISTTYVYSSDTEVLEYIESGKKFEHLVRPKKLDSLDTSIEDIIDEFLTDIDADIIVLLHPNSPFLTAATLDSCVNAVVSKNCDSAMTAQEIRKLCWWQGSPLNYSFEEPTPSLSEIEPVIAEQSSLYVFRTESYRKVRKRITKNHYRHLINHFEGLEIVEAEDFEVAELIVNSGMYSHE